jgi:hypothetical protein
VGEQITKRVVALEAAKVLTPKEYEDVLARIAALEEGTDGFAKEFEAIKKLLDNFGKRLTALEKRVDEHDKDIAELKKHKAVNVFGGAGAGAVWRPGGGGLQVVGNLTILAPIAGGSVELGGCVELGALNAQATAGTVASIGGGGGFAVVIAEAHRILATVGATQYVAGAPTQTLNGAKLNGEHMGYNAEGRVAYIGCVANILCISPYLAVGEGHASGFRTGSGGRTEAFDEVGAQARAGVEVLIRAY